ncbi:hypothetical protein ACJMK2_027722 [Sinanodonta woodiana]|uniref:Uncharacterized protein n=1 Tax=Sinanodonta woodiana TaxID=1069815 RepID=A0ABD3X6D0_SINWO
MLGAQTKYKSSSPRAIAITRVIASFIVHDLRPYSVVSNKGFLNMASVLDPRYVVPSRHVFSEKLIPDMYLQVKEDVKACLRLASKVALTTDSWTFRATESYVTVTACFIALDWTLQSYVLQTRALPESHTGTNIAAVLLSAVNKWGIPSNPPLVTDNASNMAVAASEAGCNPHTGCYAHTLNLAAHKGLKISDFSRLLGRIRRTVSFFHRSAVAA